MLQLVIRDRSFTIRELGHSSSTNVLVIERVSPGGVKVWDSAVADRENPLMSENIIEKARIHAFFGTFECTSGLKYLVVCTDADATCQIPALQNEEFENDGKIFRVMKCELVPYNPEASVSDSEARLLASLDRLLASGTFYYSAVGDSVGRAALLHRCQARSAASSRHPLDSQESVFLWNHNLVTNLCHDAHDAKSSRHFISPLMQGFALTRAFSEAGIRHSVTVISRRSVGQAGTRYNARGIDDEGNVAIFTETECIVTSSVGVDGLELFSFVQIRGSVPVFWAQPSSMSVELTRNFEMTKSAFQRHINWLTDRYDLDSSSQAKLVFVNLLSATKGGESLLSSALSNHITHLGSDSLLLIEFDFHKYVNASRPLEDSLVTLMDTLRPHIYHFGYFDEKPDSEPRRLQHGIFRVNCLDCLDRTNAVQMQIAWESVLLSKFASFPKASSAFKDIFTDVWVRNGDAISKGYSGTGSVLSRLVRTAGKGNQLATMIEHSWRSANRFIAANWDDHERQSAISHLLKKHSRLLTHDQSDFEDITIWIGTFNLHGRRVDEQRNCLSELISEPTDVVIACFQETIDLTAGSVLFSTRGDEDRNRTIDVQLLNVLETLTTDGYVQVSSESLVGMYVTVFVKSRLAVSIDTVKTRRFKAGFGGAAGNKGSVAVTFRLFKSIEVEVVNLHLDSGSDRAEERMEQLAFILENASCHNRSLLTAPLSHHHRHRSRVLFICGDFNFRCDGLSPALAVELVSKGRVEKLRLFDPFITKGASEGNVLKAAGFREMPLTFNPTYKYDVSTGELTDKRTPSWCDRIFFRSHFSNNMNLDAMYYNSIQSSRFSDHKPVIGFFALRVAAESAPPEKPTDLSGTESVESMRSDFASAVLQPNVEPVDLLSGGSPVASNNPVPEDQQDKDEWVDLLL